MTTTNLSNPNSIIPFVQGGNRMRFEMESSEPVMLSSVIIEVNFVGYGDKVVASGCNFTEVQFQAESTNSICNASWQSSNVQVMEASLNVSAGKIYYPTFYAEDYAGNVMKVKNTDTTVNYSTTPRGKSTDYRLFVDTVFPDATGIDTTNWADGKDGVIADGVTPENDRLVSNATRYIIRGNQLTLKVKAEKNTRAILQTSGSFTTLNPTSTNCTTGTDTSSNGVIVKFGSKCDLSFVYNWTGTGGQNDLGEASDYKNFSVSLVDLAGNASIESSPVAVYNDKTASSLFDSFMTSSDPAKPVIGTNDAITRNSEVELTVAGETKSDVEIEVYLNGTAMNLGKSVTLLNDSNVSITTNTKRILKYGDISNNIGDKVGSMYALNCALVGCSQTTGIDYTALKTILKLDSDGIYTIKYRQIDTAGNRSIWKQKIITRDTISPTKPELTYSRVDTKYTKLNLTISGEANAKAKIKVNGIEYFGSSNNTYSYILGCGKSNTIQVTLEDRAGNVSPESVLYIQSVACPIVSTTPPVMTPAGNTGGAELVDDDTAENAALEKKRIEIVDGLLYSENGYQRCGGKIVQASANWNPLTTKLFGWSVDEMMLEIRNRCDYENINKSGPFETAAAESTMRKGLEQIYNKSVMDAYGLVTSDWIIKNGNLYGDAVACNPILKNVADFLAGSSWGSKRVCTEARQAAWRDVLPAAASLVLGALCVGGAVITIVICALGVGVVMGLINGIVQYSAKGYIDFGELTETARNEFLLSLGAGLAFKVIGNGVKFLYYSGKTGSFKIATKVVWTDLKKVEVEAWFALKKAFTKEVVEVALKDASTGAVEEYVKTAGGALISKSAPIKGFIYTETTGGISQTLTHIYDNPGHSIDRLVKYWGDSILKTDNIPERILRLNEIGNEASKLLKAGDLGKEFAVDRYPLLLNYKDEVIQIGGKVMELNGEIVIRVSDFMVRL